MAPPAPALGRLLRPRRSTAAPAASPRPILAVDVDGVVSLMGAEESAGGGVRLELIAGQMRCISLGAGDCLRSLSGAFELVWASGWEREECESLARILGLGPTPHLSFGPDARFGSADWKIEALDAHGSERPLAWVDDNHDERCREWAARREAPTLLVGTEPERGLEESHVRELIAWARDVRAQPPMLS